MLTSYSSQFDAPFYAGVDVGGTQVKVGLVDDLGQTIAKTSYPTYPDQNPQRAFDEAKVVLDQLLNQCDMDWDDISAVGLGTPGPVNISKGMILTPVNLPGWRNFPVRDTLANILKKPVTYANDATAAAYGEFWAGSAQNYESMAMFTLGTGVGGGIIINDFVIEGCHGIGAELGHITIDSSPDARLCSCGFRGHLESYTSATALVGRTREAMSSNVHGISKTLLSDRISDTSPLTALMIAQAADAGDELSIKLIEETAVYLGKGIAQMSYIIDPVCFILGGAMNFGGSQSELGKKFLSEVTQSARRHVLPVVVEDIIVKFSELGSEAGYIGAAGLARVRQGSSVARN